jgi:hypothetical protein
LGSRIKRQVIPWPDRRLRHRPEQPAGGASNAGRTHGIQYTQMAGARIAAGKIKENWEYVIKTTILRPK